MIDARVSRRPDPWPALVAAVHTVRPRMARWGLLVLAGAELAVLMAWLPDTLRQWWYAGPLAPNDNRPMGDWQVFYAYAKALDANGLYHPILPVLQHPFTWLRIDIAYRLYTAIAALSVLAIALIAQRSVSSLEARLCVVLGVISFPEMQWALRGATLTPFLALAALGGFILLERRPVIAGVLIAVLALKPQFAVVPFAYVLLTRRWTAFATACAIAAGATIAGLLIVGPGSAPEYVVKLLDWGPDQRDNLSPIAQSWQHTWPGVLRSIGAEPNPLLWLDLVAASMVILVLACRRATPAMQAPAVALGTLLATPYAMFYDWGLLVVAGALLLRARESRGLLAPMVVIGGYVAAVMTQVATPYPPPLPYVEAGRIVWPASTFGVYLTAPFALATLAVLAWQAVRTPALSPSGAVDAP
jgi:hypothetical protein